MDTQISYPLGYSEEEARRLAEQSLWIDHITERVLQEAGLKEDMQVLDAGSGVGDVALLAARMVGPGGAVLGVERSPQSIVIARYRAAKADLSNVEFAESEIEAFSTEQRFDALTLRFVLMHVRDPITALRRLSSFVRSNGIIVAHEVDLREWSTFPRSDLFDEVTGWIVEALQGSGSEPQLGSRLAHIFVEAGLPPPSMYAEQLVTCRPDAFHFNFLANLVAALRPHIVRLGLAMPDQVASVGLADRLRQEVRAKRLTVFSGRLVGAWAEAPERRP